MKRGGLILLILSASLIAVVLLSSKEQGPRQMIEGYLDRFKKDYRIYALPIDTTLSFAGERAPIEDFEVRERVDRELLVNSYWQSSSLQFIKKSNRWFPLIEKILEEEGVPEDFKYLPLVESGFRNVTSPAGARGFWQFLKSTGQSYGLEINAYVDERYHVEKASRAACAYLKDAEKKFGSWTMAAASYNVGMAGLNKQVERQETSNYYELYLNEETSRYVPRLIAVKEIMSHPRKYGFQFREGDLYAPLKGKRIVVDTSISNLTTFCKSLGISYKHLKVYNPWLRSTSLPNRSGKKYEIIVPSEVDIQARLNEEDVHTDFSADAFKTVDELMIDSYVVKDGDTWISISSELGIDINSLKKMNPDLDELLPGQELSINN